VNWGEPQPYYRGWRGFLAVCVWFGGMFLLFFVLKAL
jgi:hypothetical protein